MKDYRVTVKLKGHWSSISYDVFKTERGAWGFAKRLAKEAFYGEDVEITVVEITVEAA